MSFANGSCANKLRFIFWNLMDSHVLKLEGPACDFTIEAWAKRAYLVQEDRRTHEVKRYEIMNCTYRAIRKISKKHAPKRRVLLRNSVCCVAAEAFYRPLFTTSSSQRCLDHQRRAGIVPAAVIRRTVIAPDGIAIDTARFRQLS